MSSSMNDVGILHISTLYQNANHGDLFRLNHGAQNIEFDLIWDKGYLLLPSLMISHKQVGNPYHPRSIVQQTPLI